MSVHFRNPVYIKKEVILKENSSVIVATAYVSGTHYDRINLTVPMGQKPVIDAHAKARGLSTHTLINELLRTEIGLSEEEWKAKAAADQADE